MASPRVVVAAIVACFVLVVATAGATDPEKLKRSQLFVMTSDHRIIRTDLFRFVNVTDCAIDAHDVEVNNKTRMVYWATASNIYGQDYNMTAKCGSDLVGLITSGLPGSPSIGRIAIDKVNNYMYFTEITNKNVMRVPLAGGAATTVVAFANSFGPPTGIAVAPELNTIAYSFNGADSGGTVRHGLGRAELDGSNPKSMFQYSSSTREILGISYDAKTMDILYVEKRGTNEMALQQVDISNTTATWWNPSHLVTGVSGTQEMYVAADSVHNAVWWSHKEADVVYSAKWNNADHRLPRIDVGSGYPQGLSFSTGVQPIGCCMQRIKLLDDPPSDAPADWCAGVDCGDGSDNAGVQLTAVGITTLLAVLLAAFTATVGL